VSVSQFQNRSGALSLGATVLVSAICLTKNSPPRRTRRIRRTKPTGIDLRVLCVLCGSWVFSGLQKRLRIDPLPQLELEMPALVHEDLPVVGEDDARALERARRRPLEIDSGEAEAAAVARA